MSPMVEETPDDPVAPWAAIASPVEADMAAVLGKQRRQHLVCRPTIAAVERTGNPGVVEGGQHQRRDADPGHEAHRLAALIVVLGTGKAVARRNEGVVVLPDRGRTQDG